MVDVEDGQIVEGTVVKVDKDEVLLDIGYKSEGVIPARELSIRNDVDPSRDRVSSATRSRPSSSRRRTRRAASSCPRSGPSTSGPGARSRRSRKPTASSRARSSRSSRAASSSTSACAASCPPRSSSCAGCATSQPYVGRTLEAKIIELDKNRNNVVLSRRAWLEETQKEQREDFLANLKPGEVRKGVVSSVVNFGAFVDLGGMDGLIHVSELSWKHVDHPGSVVAVGDEVTVQVLDVDLDRERISLSLKATQQDPWQEFATTHRVGELVYGRVTKLVPFGAFVQVGDGIEGLVHISEMSAHHVDLPEQVVTPGEELWVKIIDLDLARRRISLSIKQAAEGGERGRGVPASTSASTPTTTRATTSAAPTTPSARRPGPSTTRSTARKGPGAGRRRRPAEAAEPAEAGCRPPCAAAASAERPALSERQRAAGRRAGPELRQLHDAHPHRLEHGLGAVAGVELLVDRRQVVLHRLLADVELLGHLGRGAAVGDELEHLFLALGDDAVLLARRPARRACGPRRASTRPAAATARSRRWRPCARRRRSRRWSSP